MIDKITKLAKVLNNHNINYLFKGFGGAILYGYPGTTQDIDIYPQKTLENCKGLATALEKFGFMLDKTLKDAIIKGKDFIQIRGGPLPIDIIFAPDGIESFEKAKKHSKTIDGIFPCASINDIIESKRAAKRQRDKEELPRLEAFRKELEKR